MSQKRILPVIALLLANSLAATLVLPILPLVAVSQFGASVFQALLLETCYYGAKLIAAPILGRSSDRHGRRPILLLSQTGTVIAFTLFVVAHPASRQLSPVLGLNSGLVILYLARLLDGVTAGSSTVAKAYVADVVPEQARPQVLGWLSATLGIGFIFGPVTGGLLSARFGPLVPFVVAGTLTFAALVGSTLTLRESVPPKTASHEETITATRLSLAHIFRQTIFVRITTMGFLATLCFSAISAIFVLYIDAVFFANAADLSAAGRFAGLAFTIIGVTLAVTQIFLIKPLVKKYGEIKIVQFSQVSMATTFVIIPFVTNRTLFLLLAIPFVFVYGLLEPNLQAIVSRTDDKIRGRLFGLYQSTLSGADLLGPIWVALAFESISPQSVWWLSGVLMFLSFAISLTFRSHSRLSLVSSNLPDKE
ncbi:MAG: MFS transporter [Chloroflexota bacterium]